MGPTSAKVPLGSCAFYGVVAVVLIAGACTSGVDGPSGGASGADAAPDQGAGGSKLDANGDESDGPVDNSVPGEAGASGSSPDGISDDGQGEGSTEGGDASLDAAQDAVTENIPNPACGPDPTWSNRYGDVVGDYGYAVATDPAEGVYVGGKYEGSIDFGQGPVGNGNRDAFVVKLDASGNTVWSRLGNAGSEGATHLVALDSSGNILAAGIFGDSIDFGASSVSGPPGASSTFLLKLSPSGEPLWLRGLVSTTSILSVEGRSLAIDPSGNSVLSGSFGGDLDLGNGVVLSGGSTGKAFLAKFDPSGKAVWGRAFGKVGFSVAIDAAGAILLAGSASDGGDVGGQALAAGLLLGKLDSSGTHVWSKSLAPQSSTAVTPVVDADGNLLVAGSYPTPIDLGGGPLPGPGPGLFVAKFDSSGAWIWDRGFPYTAQQLQKPGVRAIAAAKSGGRFSLGGSLQGSVDFGGGALNSPSYNTQAWLAQFDGNGSHLWSRSFGGSNDNGVKALAFDPTGKLLVTGYFDGTITWCSSATLTTAGYRDAFVAKF
ncbi:MAG: hypothetical protein HY898_10750 [Deltaproteobacteria bacterium]|nr:hypothetical protein [Deltaproteobacteria bacterium]